MLLSVNVFFLVVIVTQERERCAKGAYSRSKRRGEGVGGPGFGNLFLEDMEFIAEGVESLARLCCATEDEAVVWDLCHFSSLICA